MRLYYICATFNMCVKECWWEASPLYTLLRSHVNAHTHTHGAHSTKLADVILSLFYSRFLSNWIRRFVGVVVLLLLLFQFEFYLTFACCTLHAVHYIIYVVKNNDTRSMYTPGLLWKNEHRDIEEKTVEHKCVCTWYQVHTRNKNESRFFKYSD